MSKRPYTNRGTERFATSQSQGSEAEQTNRGYAEAEASQAVPAACAEHRGHGSGQVHQRPDAREQLVWVGERVGVQRHDGGFLIDDPDHAALLGGRLAERIDPLAVVVADHDHPRMTGDRVDAEIDRPAAELKTSDGEEVTGVRRWE